MNHSLRSLQLSILFLGLFLSTSLSAAVVGTTKGEFSVNQGTANYELKIDVPPGVAGMEPKLSLNYSSAGGNGYMGVGWDIGGVSTISRCPQTKAVDGANHKFGVKYDENDKFCLDGQRLINVSGAYGADGTEYRTEIDTYSKIISQGDRDGGPGNFIVKTKSGLTYVYASNQATTSTGVWRYWNLSRIKDTYNNSIIFSYKRNYVQGFHYLDKVTYADNTVQYNYETRPDVMKGYHSGYPTFID